MLFNSLTFLLLSNSITSRRDKSILYYRNTITMLMVSACTAYYSISILFLAKGIGISVGIFHNTANTNVFHIFILFITSVIFLLTSFCPRKALLKEYGSPQRILFTKLIYYGSLLLNNMGEQFKVIERSIITLFIATSGFIFSNFHFWFIPVHYWFIFLFLYCQKDRITIKKFTGLTLIVFITPLILHSINFVLPYLLDNLPFILFEFNHLISRIMVFFFSIMYRVLFKIFSKKGFIDILTSISIIYVIRVVLLGSLSILNIVSNLVITNCIFSLTIEFYSINLIKVVTPYMEKIFTGIIKPFFASYLSPIHCDSPKVVAKLFSELPFYNVDSNVIIEECKTSKTSTTKSRKDLIAEFKAFRVKMSSYTPSFIISVQSGDVSNIEQSEPSRGQLFNVKKRALYNTQEEGYNKRVKIVWVHTKSTTVTKEDFDGENWDLHSIYEKINNLMEDPNYNPKWEISRLFKDKSLHNQFKDYIKVYELTLQKNARRTTLVHLKKNIEEEIKTEDDPNSIKRGDFTENSLNLVLVHNKIAKIMEKEDFNKDWTISKLTFEPWSLRHSFYAIIQGFNLNICKNVANMTIAALRNRIWEEYSMLNHKPNSITRDDFTKDGLNFESIYNKIKQSIEDGQCTRTDPIHKLFPPKSQIKKDFYTKLRTLNLMDANIKTTNVKIRTLINILEKVVDVPSIKSSTVTREDFDGENWDLHSIYEKINNLMEDPNYNPKWEIDKLFENKSLQNQFKDYIKVYELTSLKNARRTTLVHLKKNLEEEIKTENDPNSIKRGDFTKNSLNLLLVHNKIAKIMEKEDFNKDWTISKLTFEPWSLRLPFYATIEALNLNTNKNVCFIKISALRNRIWEEYSMINHKPNSITRDDFTKDGLNFESIYNKIKQSIEDGQCTRTDPIHKLFPAKSQIKEDFYTKLRTLNWMDANNRVSNVKIRTLINLLEKVVDVPSVKNNSITREDLRDEDWDLYSIHEKINNLMKDPNFDKKSKLAKLEFEPANLRKEFYDYIKNFNLAKANPSSRTTILSLKNNLEKHFKDNDS